jgi:ribosomal protein S18 acetylase RimI-like enzyme
MIELESIRPVGKADYSVLSSLLSTESHIHRHLDWRQPLEWLGRQPFLIAERGKDIRGVLACPPDPASVCWIRLFAAFDRLSRGQIWNHLLDAVLTQCDGQQDSLLAAIALNDWFERLLQGSGFANSQDIVVLEWVGPLPPPVEHDPSISIREMNIGDLPDVYQLDVAAFQPLWQNSEDMLRLAFEQSATATVAVADGTVLGYQISTSVPLSGHLARLAVHPRVQRSHIGYALVYDLLTYFKMHRAWRVTVNTQNDNLASLALYKKAGFRATGERFRVYTRLRGDPKWAGE